MDGEIPRITFSVGPDYGELRLEGGLGVANAEELRVAAETLAGDGKDVMIEWSGATQIDGGIVQVLLALRADLARRNCVLTSRPGIPQGIRNWLADAGLSEMFANPGQA